MLDLTVAQDKRFYYVRDSEQVQPALEILSKADRYAADTETCIRDEWRGRGGSALDPHTGEVALLILAMKDLPPFVIDTITLSKQESKKFVELLTRPGVYSIWHNARFDWQMIYGSYGIRLRNIHCTLVMSQLLGNATGSKAARARGHGYADVCRDFLNKHIEGKKSLRTSVWNIDPEARTLENLWWLEKLAYGATDVVYLHKIHDLIEHVLTRPLPQSILNPEGALEDPGFEMRQVLELEWRLTPVIAGIEYAGLPCSKQMLNAVTEAVHRNLDIVGLRLAKAFNLGTEVQDPWTGEEVASKKAMTVLRSPEGLKKLISKHVGINIDTTEGAFLERMLSIIDQISKGFSADREGDTDGSTAVEVDFTSDEEREEFAQLLELEEANLTHNSQLVRDILTFKRLVKQTGMDLRKFINPKTQRLQFRLLQCGTATGRTCVAKGQRVLTPRGWVAIESLKVGDLVYSYDDIGQVCLRPITNWWSHGQKQVIKLRWEWGRLYGRGGQLICTPGHLIGTKQGWVPAAETSGLKVWAMTPELLGYGATSAEANILGYSEGGTADIFDIEVEEYHNFICEGLKISNSSSKFNVQQIPARLYLELWAEGAEPFIPSSEEVLVW